MRHVTKPILLRFAGRLFLAALVAAPAFPQAQVNPLQRPGTGVQGQPQGTQRAIPFKPFAVPDPKTGAVPDPKTGQPIPPSTMLTLPSGKKITAGEYYRQLNELEQKLNQTGHSLREHTRKLVPTAAPKPVRRMRGGPQSAPPTPAEAGRVKAMLSPQVALQNQKSEAANKTRRASGTARLMLVPAATGLRGDIPPIKVSGADPGKARVPSTAFTERYKTSQYWQGWTAGDPSTFYINVGGGRLDLEGVRRGDNVANPGDVTTANIHAEAEIAGAVFGQSFEMLRMTADAHAPQGQPADVTLELKVLGSDAFPPWSANGIGIQTDPNNPPGFQHNFGPAPVTIPLVQVGPFQVVAHAGFNAQAGVKLYYGLFPTNAYADVQPYVNSGGYVAVDFGIGVAGIDIASVGVRGNLTFLNDGVDMSGSVALLLDPDAGNSPYFDVAYSGTEYYSILSGNIYVYATADLPVGVCQLASDNCDCNWFGVCTAEWDSPPIVSWSGLTNCGPCLWDPGWHPGIPNDGTPLFGGEEKIPL